jgi:hypothetical protein
MRPYIASSIALLLASGCARRGEEESVKSRSLMLVRHVSVAIDRPPAEVYRFAADPENLPRWAKGLADAPVQVDGDVVIASSPMGKVTVRFAPSNELGVLDHDVTLPSGITVHNPMRVVPNGDGSEVVFSVFRRPDVTDAQFEADTSAVARDLHALQALLER